MNERARCNNNYKINRGWRLRWSKQRILNFDFFFFFFYKPEASYNYLKRLILFNNPQLVSGHTGEGWMEQLGEGGTVMADCLARSERMETKAVLLTGGHSPWIPLQSTNCRPNAMAGLFLNAFTSWTLMHAHKLLQEPPADGDFFCSGSSEWSGFIVELWALWRRGEIIRQKMK